MTEFVNFECVNPVYFSVFTALVQAGLIFIFSKSI